MKNISLILIFLIPYFVFAQKDFTVTVHEISDPDGMNPITSYSANALYMQGNVFQKLLDYDMQTLELRPVLAKEMPIVNEIKEGKYKGGMSISYEIHPDAVWDNGKPITAEDYIFTIKAIKNPKVNSYGLRPYFDFIEEIIIDKNNKKKFTIYSSKTYFRGVETTGQEPFILPEYHYDVEQIMRNFSFEDLDNPDKLAELSKNPEVLKFANSFNDSKYARSPDEIIGSGPYRMETWQTRQFVHFKKKQNWWGDKIKSNDLLAAYPSDIKYKIDFDMNSAISQAKNGSIDVIRSMPPSKFIELDNDPNFKENFDLSTPQQFAYHYLGLNSKLPKLQDVRVRKAIAHAIDRDEIINSIFEGYATKTNSPISPVKDYYNHTIKDIDLDLEKAKEYLNEAGWADKDGDGILDKMINGKLEKLSLTFSYNQGNTVRKIIGQLLKDNLKQLNIELTLEPVDFPTLLDKANSRDFEIIALAWVKTAGADDMKQVWHSSSDTEGGSNRVGFGNAASDEIIDKIQTTIDKKKRKDLYLDIQQKIAAAQCYIFLVVPNELLAISNKFDHPKPSSIRPAYIARFFQLK